ncbi:matrilin-2-like [Polypterus senegalus]|uniref:matrilin-2-like n=1 Tax=Polypterus senegalus TaxID=55291 RepID=UPI001962568F|nr:matrilin-2-like [Polypterus senegalus]XP_039592669.1 matrilin-2-like [Polypterus senegalus]XP_039592670.1 matrilin-2-like [Polypterus senegalus]
MNTRLIRITSMLLFQSLFFSIESQRIPSVKEKEETAKSNLLENPCKGAPLDFIFIIDSSRSVRPDDYERVKTFIINILKFLDVGPDATRVGLVQYGSIVQNEFSLKNYTRKVDMEKAVQGMVHLASGTMTGLAIEYTMNVAFSEEEGARPLAMHIPRIAMIVTDGRPQDTVEEVSAQAREAGIIIYVIGVGRVDMATLRSMGSEPHEEHVFLVANFSQIETLTSMFQSKFCKGGDLCGSINHQCSHLCINIPGSYVCRCRKGYILNPDGKTCSALDMCATENHGCQHLCVTLPGSYKCQCRVGYELNEDQKTCSRVDFCDLGNHGCEHDCITTVESYICKCRRGFTLNPDGKTCSRINHCAFGTHGCEQECVNTMDSFICRCHAGYTLNLDGKTCTRVDHCAGTDNGCEHICLNTDESYICQCNEGYILNEDLKTCTKVDYCALFRHDCEHLCLNTEKSYICQCFDGYTLNADGKTCRRPDICSIAQHGCEHLCVNTEDSYICKCFDGFTLAEDGKKCRKCADGAIDLMFVIDGSKSLGPDNFEKVKQFVSGLVSSLDVSPKASRVGLLQYSTKVRSEFTLGQHKTAAEVTQAVSKIEYMGRGSMTGSALKYMFEKSFTEAEGARPSSAHVARVSIVFTDGRSQDDVSEWADKAKKSGITMYAVGVGKAIEGELHEIASEPQNKHLYYAEDFSNMGTIAEKLKSRICEEKPATEDQCMCENVIQFHNQATEQIQKLTVQLEKIGRKLESLENQLIYN